MAIHGNEKRYPIVQNPNAKDRFLIWDTVNGRTIQVPISNILAEEGFSLQDNIRRVLTTHNQTSQNYNIHDLINTSKFLPFDSDFDLATPTFTIDETETLIVKVPRTSSKLNSQAMFYDYWKLIEIGKGTYGLTGDTVVTANNFLFERTTQTEIISSDTSEPPVVYNFYTSQDIDTPHICVNNQAADFEVLNSKDYYFKIFTLSNSKLAQTPNNPYRLYRFVGSEGNYGTLGGDTSVALDFELVNASSETSLGLKVRTIYVGAVMEAGTGISNIAEAVQSSVRGMINIENDELVLFQAHRKIGNSLILEQYYWKNGKASNITVDCEPADFQIDFEKSNDLIILDPPSKNAETKVFNVYSPDKITPEEGVNLSDTSLVFNTDDFDIYVFSRPYNDQKSSVYNLYKYTGASLTYGVGSGNTAINGDFLLIDTFGDADNPPTTSKGILKGRRIVVGAIINGTDIADDDISKAVNRSFRGIITVQPNELLIFEAQRKITDPDTKNATLFTEKYRWMGRTNVINGDSVLADFDIDYEKKAIAELPTDKDETPQVNPVAWNDLDTPENAVNNSDDSFVISADQDFYFIVYDENVNTLNYKIYKYIGAVQTIGDGGVTVVNGDFELVDKVDDDTEPYFTTGTPFANVGTGTPNQDPTSDAFRSGRIALGIEENPEELLDIVGSETEGKGSFKLDYTYDSGLITRIQFGGQKILSELGVPSNTVEGLFIDSFSPAGGSYPNFRSYFGGGDLSGVNALLGEFSSVMGVGNVSGSKGVGINIYPIAGAGEFFTGNIRAYVSGGSQAAHSVAHKGSTAGEDQEHKAQSIASNGTETTSIGLTPHYAKISNITFLTAYGSGTFVVGYTHTDTAAKTGTTETTIGANTYALGVDAAGVIMEIPKPVLEGINEGNGIGYPLYQRTAANYGNIGAWAFDFSESDSASSVMGSTASKSVTFGFNNKNNGTGTMVVGYDCEVQQDGGTNVTGYNLVVGFYHDVYNWTYSSLILGEGHKISTSGTTGGSSNPVAYQSLVSGLDNELYAGRSSALIGANLLSGSGGCVVVGISNIDLTDTEATQLQTTLDIPANPVFIVGNGDYNTVTKTGTRSNAFVVMLNGNVSFPSLTTGMIDAAGLDTALTKEWVFSKRREKGSILIGDWDMNSTAGVSSAHSLSSSEWKTIRNVSFVIRNDSDDEYITNSPDIDISVDATNININRQTGSAFESAGYDSTSYNRGYITFEYTPDSLSV